MNNPANIGDFFMKLDRSLFIDGEYKSYASYDSALPIGFEQTISQPSLVYRMTLELIIDKSHKILEIGTGSGYQTAFLAEFGGEVFTVERIGELSNKARKRLANLGYNNVRYRVGNGSEGWPESAPFDRIMVTAAAAIVPEPLIEQLDVNGRMVIPIGERYSQDLLLITKDSRGKVKTEFLEKVIFVELKGQYGWENHPAP